MTLITTLTNLATQLDRQPAPIDYNRRRALNYHCLLPLEQWHQIALEHNIHPGTTRHQHARNYLYALLSGNPAQDGPATAFPDRTLAPGYTRFRSALPEEVHHALLSAGASFLTSNGIHGEPTTWHPANPPTQRPSARTATMPPKRPSVARHPRPASNEINQSYQAGTSIRDLAKTTDLSREQVRATIVQAGTPIRPAHRPSHQLDDNWLRDQYLLHHHSIRQIATDVGCGPSTISRHLKALNVPLRARGIAPQTDSR